MYIIKLVSITLILAAVAFASPAPVAAPKAAAALAAVAKPKPQSISAEEALPPRVATPAKIEVHNPKKSTPKIGKNSRNITNKGAAGMLTLSRALQIGTIRLGVMEVVRLWG
jgi:hypothetical protein